MTDRSELAKQLLAEASVLEELDGINTASPIMRQAATALSAGGGVGVPDGWQLVPKIPTSEMIDAAWEVTRNRKPEDYIVANTQAAKDSHAGKMRSRYGAMLCAAPSTPTPQAPGEEGLREELARTISRWPMHVDGFGEAGIYSAELRKEWRDRALSQADEVLAIIRGLSPSIPAAQPLEGEGLHVVGWLIRFRSRTHNSAEFYGVTDEQVLGVTDREHAIILETKENAERIIKEVGWTRAEAVPVSALRRLSPSADLIAAAKGMLDGTVNEIGLREAIDAALRSPSPSADLVAAVKEAKEVSENAARAAKYETDRMVWEGRAKRLAAAIAKAEGSGK